MKEDLEGKPLKNISAFEAKAKAAEAKAEASVDSVLMRLVTSNWTLAIVAAVAVLFVWLALR